jgi:uncharacterized protein (DUF111 family)
MTGEELASAASALLEAGALDVWLTPIVMKKGRPGTLLAVLCETSAADDTAESILRQTTTIGVRLHSVSRKVLSRRVVEVTTSLGPVRVKISGEPGMKAKPEADAVARLAALNSLSFADARRRVVRELPDLLEGFDGVVI